jgi:hypothetical protein
MSDWLMRVIKGEAKHLIALAAEDDELRAQLRAFANEILAATENPAVATTTAPDESDSSMAIEPAESKSTDTVEPLRELTLGRSVSAIHEPRVDSTLNLRGGATHSGLAEIERNCRRKAEAARWAVERLLRIREGNDCRELDVPLDPEMAEWASQMTDCLCWVQTSESSEKADLSLLDDLAGCFETLAEALESVDVVLAKHHGNKAIERILPLVVEAQSAVSGALKRLGASDDPDQLEVFEWVKASAARQHVYVKRFMRADDLANPAGWSDLLMRIERAAASGQLGRQHAGALEQIKDRLTRIRAGEDAEQEWQAVIQIVDTLVESGVPPSNREIRDALLPVIDGIPERKELPDGFRLVLREIDRYLARRPSAAAASVAVSHLATEDVSEAARLIRGRSIVLIGGIRRREAQESLRRGLYLSDLIWIETKEHQSIDSFEPMIARADVAVVLLAIRWSSHAFGDVRLFCDRHHKPLVRLPGGYSPNQVAAQILAQCSGKLEGGH